MSQKQLSIIVPSYNMEKYLPKCLGSLVVAPELMEKLEVLVVNDGSKDRTSEIAHEFAAKWPGTFKVIDKENGHYGSCVNEGLKIASGKFVKVVDADDAVDGMGLCELLDFLSRVDSEVGLVLSDYCIVDENDAIVQTIYFELPKAETIDLSTIPERVEIQAIAYRREVLMAVSYRQTEGICYTDLEWITYPMAGVRRVSYLPSVVTRYLVGREGQTVTPATYAKNGEMLIKINRRFVEYYESVLPRCANASGRAYVARLIQLHVRNIYATRTIRTGPRVAGSLSDYDDWLKSKSRELYDAMDDFVASSRHFSFHYIREWRKRKSIWTLKFMLFRVYVYLVSFRAWILSR